MVEKVQPWAVLNPGGRDATQWRADGSVPLPGEGHAPVNVHAYAFCTGGGFFRRWEEIPDSMQRVLILLRKDGRAAAEALRALQATGRNCWVSVKEAGYFQLREQLDRAGVWEKWSEVVRRADGALAPTEHLLAFWDAAGAKRTAFVPTPYPVEVPEWNFARPIAEQSGIFLGTREFGVASRRHLVALRLALRLGAQTGRVVRLLDDGSCPGWLRKELRKQYAPSALEWVRAPLAYPEYLGLLAEHEMVFQLDRSGVPGQVAGDCALAGTLLIGGDGTNEQLIFPETCGVGRGELDLMQLAEAALQNVARRRELLEKTSALARQQLSYASGAKALQALPRCPLPKHEQ
jgi:hypothetical protein